MIIYEYVEKHTCASCAYYKFEGLLEKSICTKHNYIYCFPEESCKFWEESSDVYHDKRPINKY